MKSSPLAVFDFLKAKYLIKYELTQRGVLRPWNATCAEVRAMIKFARIVIIYRLLFHRSSYALPKGILLLDVDFNMKTIWMDSA